MKESKIVRRFGGHAVGRLASVSLVALMLWMGSAASASAQSMPPTSPCTVGIGELTQPPPGWTRTGTPDCSNLTTWSNNGLNWLLGNVPATPGGHASFVNIVAHTITGTPFTESLSTTITGLVPGSQYNVNVYFNGNYTAAVGAQNYARSCQGTVTINGVSTPYPAASGNSWVLRSYPFTAAGSTATFSIAAQLPPSAGCISNIFVAANAVVPVVVPTDVQVTKAVSPTGAAASGSVLTYTLIARNNGPAATTNVLLRDTPGAGLNCTTPSPTAACSASGGASCPGATVPVSSLTGGGVTLPNLPVGGQVAVTMQCTVTATGR